MLRSPITTPSPVRNPIKIDAGKVWGDVDGNGVVETADALLALRGAMGIAALTPEQAERADMDGNGVVDTVDALAILRRAILNG